MRKAGLGPGNEPVVRVQQDGVAQVGTPGNEPPLRSDADPAVTVPKDGALGRRLRAEHQKGGTRHVPLPAGSALSVRSEGARLSRAAFPNVLDAAGIVKLERRALSLVGGKNFNMAILNSIPGVRGAEFRAVTAAGYDRHLDEARIDPARMDAFLARLFRETDFKALGAKDGNAFQQDFVLNAARELRGAAAGHGGAAQGLREYVAELISRAKAELARPHASLEERLGVLRRLSISAQVAILAARMPAQLEVDIRGAYRDLCAQLGKPDLKVAVRSSAVGEDSDEAAFAGAQDTYLNIQGADAVVEHVQRNFASGFNVRALEYRLSQIDKEVEERGTPLAEALEKFDFDNIAVSVTIQQMIRSQKAGTAFSVDPASGLSGVVSIDANFGYGESVVGGRVTPDNYLVSDDGRLLVKTLGDKTLKVVDKPGGGTTEAEIHDRGERFGWVLGDDEAKRLADMVRRVAGRYGKHVDTEFGIDEDGPCMLQARPETKYNEENERAPGLIPMRRFEVPEKALKGASVAVKGDGASKGAAVGRVRFVENIHDPEVLAGFKKGDILAAERTDPDFLPLFKRASAILADVGGRTSHAAITSRELNIPAVIGIGDAASLRALDGREVTVDGSRGAVYLGTQPLENKGQDIDTRALAKLKTSTSVGLILADIDQAKALSALRTVPDFKVGLLRAEFVLGAIGVHYKALKAYDRGVFREAQALYAQGKKAVEEALVRRGDDEHTTLLQGVLQGVRALSPKKAKAELERVEAEVASRLERSGFRSGHEFYVEMLSQKIALFAYSFRGKDVIYRTTDYKSNEYEGLLGGSLFEEKEPNPMIGYRGVSRGIDPWEIEAFRKARDVYGAENLHIMFPFVRTEDEIVQTVAASRAQGLVSGDKGLKVFVMAEIPSVATLPKSFLRHVDGFSIGSNDLTQGMLMTDRDSARLQRTYDEEDPAVVQGMLSVIFSAVGSKKEVGFCGQGVSNSEFLAAMVSVAGISSASVTPDVYVKVKQLIHDIEARKLGVAQLGQWMNEYKAAAMQKELAALDKTGLFGQRTAELAPEQAYAFVQGALVEAHTKLGSAAAEQVERGRHELLALSKASKAVIAANTDWREIVANALFTAGFQRAEDYDKIVAAERKEKGAKS